MSAQEQDGISIAAVEQATGIARATLRIWERRYGFPVPGRDPRGERSYTAAEVEKLRLIAGLMARGQRPGRLVQLTPSELRALGAPAATNGRTAAARAAGGDVVLDAVRAHDTVAIAAHLEDALRSPGLPGFMDRLARLNDAVGEGWACGELQVYEEHLYTEVVQQVLRNFIARLPAPSEQARPRVLLATFAGESHALGLLMAQAVLAAEGCRCVSLGVKVPVPQLADAARAFEPDIVALSFSGSLNPAHVLRGLEQLRGELPPQVAVWAGGSHPVLARRRVAGVQAFSDVTQVPEALERWRVENGVEAVVT